MSEENLIIGIGGHAVRIDPATGAEVWRTKLKGSNSVTIHSDGAHVLAGAEGELFCLETATGQILWKNKLKGLGMGLVTFMSSDSAAVAVDLARKRAAQTAAGAAAAS